MARPHISRSDSTLSHRSSDFEHFYSCIHTVSNHQHGAFRDIDQPEGLQAGLEALTSRLCSNTVLDFTDRHAWAGYDLSSSTVLDLIKAGGWPSEPSTRWIDISYPARSKDLLEKLAYHYDFSPRLLAMMCSEPRSVSNSGRESNISRNLSPEKLDGPSSSQDDVERLAESIDHESMSSANPARTGNLYELLEEVRHFSSVDQGAKYLCLGYNSLYSTGGVQLPADQLPSQSHGPLPNSISSWTWLVLCDDRTVISINEDLFPTQNGHLSTQQKSIYLRTKQNVVNIFRSLSLAADAPGSSLNRLPIRKRLAEGDQAAAERAKDAPGLLFYFLFENWFNSYSLVTRRDSRYGNELVQIRKDMFEQPDLTQIERLDEVGNDLGVLKRHFSSYIRLIDRVIESSSLYDSSTLASSQVTARMFGVEDIQTFTRPAGNHDRPRIGVNAGAAAYVRFERLKDMITLYALSEVEEYLQRKQALVDMNFQLIAIKESRDVERLTRVGLFITKMTMLFLPVSFMTSYFDISLSGHEYTVTQYWVSFSIILVVSYAILMVFGVISGTMENWAFVAPMRTKLRHRMRGSK